MLFPYCTNKGKLVWGYNDVKFVLTIRGEKKEISQVPFFTQSDNTCLLFPNELTIDEDLNFKDFGEAVKGENQNKKNQIRLRRGRMPDRLKQITPVILHFSLLKKANKS